VSSKGRRGSESVRVREIEGAAWPRRTRGDEPCLTSGMRTARVANVRRVVVIGRPGASNARVLSFDIDIANGCFFRKIQIKHIGLYFRIVKSRPVFTGFFCINLILYLLLSFFNGDLFIKFNGNNSIVLLRCGNYFNDITYVF
jgi:hypothetical protein